MLFSEITIGTMFNYQGTTFKKKSARTAFIYGRPSCWFYFSKGDVVIEIKTQ